VGAFLAVMAALILVQPAAAESHQDRNPDFTFKQPSPEELQQAMSVWMELGQPTIYHERLEFFVGDWDVVTKLWMGGPGSPAQESTGTATYSWLMEGRWLATDFQGNMMGMPFDGFQLTGYDNYRREYVGIWVDSMSTSLSVSSGRLDQEGTVITMYGEMDDPSLGHLGKMAKYVTRIVDENTFVFEIHDLAIGGDATKVVEMTYTRRI
jgi:hypothetical protein